MQRVEPSRSVRLKREMASAPHALWVAGYSNDVFVGYLGSRRVIIEGGYEGYGTTSAIGHPGPWATTTEDRVIDKAYELIRSINH